MPEKMRMTEEQRETITCVHCEREVPFRSEEHISIGRYRDALCLDCAIVIGNEAKSCLLNWWLMRPKGWRWRR